jgi:hypothetical protein
VHPKTGRGLAAASPSKRGHGRSDAKWTMRLWRAPAPKLLSALRSKRVPKLPTAPVDVPVVLEVLADLRAAELGALRDALRTGGERVGLRLRVVTPAETAALAEALEGVAEGEVAALLSATSLEDQPLWRGASAPPRGEVEACLRELKAQVRAAAAAAEGLILDFGA